MTRNVIISALVILLILLIFVTHVAAAPSETLVNATRRIYLHYVKWCPHCKIMYPVWESVRRSTIGSNIIYVEIDEDAAKTPGIYSYPTIIMLDEHGKRYNYWGGPDYITLRDWVISPHVV